MQISSADVRGGAERIAWTLFEAYRARGHGSFLVVGKKSSRDPDVFELPDRHADGQGGPWSALRRRIVRRRLYTANRLKRFAYGLADPVGSIERFLGVEDFRFPQAWRVMDIGTRRPDVLHCHNLHPAYFDLRALPWLSRQVPVFITLHDAWMLAGHCAHSFECERWRTGCGKCPDLSTYPAVERDATAYNWRRKQDIYSRSRVHVATPSRWLMNKVEHSMLAPGVASSRVIPNGVDMSVFHAGDKRAARAQLGLAQEGHVLLFTGIRARSNMFKDYAMMRAVVAGTAERLGPKSRLHFIALGEDGPAEELGQARISFVPFESDPQSVASYYRAADVYLHAAKADTFPNSVIEALACGTPVVATATGGIPEQVKRLHLDIPGFPDVPGSNTYSLDDANGILVAPGDADAMTAALVHILHDSRSGCLAALSANAARDARERFDADLQITCYLEWYRQVHADWH